MTTQPETAQIAQPPPLSIWRRAIVRTWVRDLFVSVGISTFFIIFLYQPVRVEGSSMLPGLEDQERIFINKFVYRWEPVSRGDIVVFRYPKDPGKSYIKRVVAIAGDRLVIDKGRVYVNGELLDESYVPARYADVRSYPETLVPPDSYFVLGDHRSMSSDSREFGPIDQQYVIGKAVFIYWPMEKFGLLR